MKTLVNKNNPAIRITAPEIGTGTHGYYYVDSVGYHKDKWTLVEEEPKYTEVWVEGRTIFEQDARKPEVDLDKAADISANEVYPPMIEVYPRIPNSTCVEFKQKVIDHNAHNRVLHIEGFKAGAEWQQKQRNKELREKIDEYWNAGYEAGAEWQKQRDKEWMEAKEKEFKDIRDTTRWVNRDLGYNDGFEAGKERAFKQFSDILDKWEAHATEGMRVGASAYHQGKIALICDLMDWIKEQTQKTIEL